MSITGTVLESRMSVDPNITLQNVKSRINGGGRLLLDSLSKEELAAMATLLMAGEAEIINEACKPFLVRKLTS
jgi:hypothetical protein